MNTSYVTCNPRSGARSEQWHAHIADIHTTKIQIARVHCTYLKTSLHQQGPKVGSFVIPIHVFDTPHIGGAQR